MSLYAIPMMAILGAAVATSISASYLAWWLVDAYVEAPR